MSNSEKLYRSNTDKVIGGVAGGLADYFNIDAVIIRIIFVLLVLFGGGGILVYIILWIAIPTRVTSFSDLGTNGPAVEESAIVPSRKKNTSLIAGIVLIAFGVLILLGQIIPFYSFSDFWPLLLIMAGVLLLMPEIFKPSKKVKS